MNEIDEQILEILTRDARIPLARIGEEVGLSRPAVTERIKKLEQAGFIKGYSAILDPISLGQNITAFISAKHLGVVDEKTQQALGELAKRKEILEVHSLAGEDCYFIKVQVADIATLNEIVNSLKKPPLSMSTKTTIVLKTYFEKVGGTILKGE